MNLRDQLLHAHSKANNQLICDWIGDDPERFAELMALFLTDEYRVVQRAAWAVSGVGIKYPQLIPPHLDQLIQSIVAPIHQAVQRSVLKLLAEIKLPFNEDQEGQLINTAFELLSEPTSPIAIRVHAMQVIANFCKTYPDLSIELKVLIEEGMEHGSAGFKSRGRRILKALK